MQLDKLGQPGPARNKKWINPEFGRQQWAAEDKNLFHSDRETAAGRLNTLRSPGRQCFTKLDPGALIVLAAQYGCGVNINYH